MKKLSTLLAFLLTLFVSTTYLYYTHWRGEQQRTAAIPCIPAGAALVYEVTDFNKQWEYCQQTGIGQALSTLPPFKAIHEAMTWLKQEISTDLKKLERVSVILSLHKSLQGRPGCLLYFNTHDEATRDFWTTVTSKLEQDDAYHTTTREYAHRKITSWHKEGNKRQLAYIRHKQYVIAGFSDSLVEELADAFADNHAASFLSLHKSDNESGSLYINPEQLSQLIHTFVNPDQAKAFSNMLAILAPSSQFNLQFTPHHILFTGTVAASDSQHPFHTMAGQAPGPIDLAAYLPQDTATLQHVTFSHADRFLEAWQEYGTPSGTLSKDAEDLLMSTLLPLLQGELAHCTLPTKPGRAGGKLVLMKVTDPQAFISVLKSAKVLTPVAAAQTYRITPDCFRNGLPGLLFPSFKASYLTHVNDYIVLANCQDALKAWRAQYRQGKTWTKSTTKNAWLAGTLDKAHLTWQVDLQQAWPTLMKSLRPQGQQAFKSCTAPAIDASLQLLNDATGGCYASILLSDKERGQARTRQVPSVRIPLQTASTTIKTPPGKVLFQAAASLAHSPWLVKSHRSQGHHVLLQDAQHQLCLLNPNGKLLWKKSLEGPITTRVFEIDFYKNNKTQYLFATGRQLHLVDYYGRGVGPYPQSLPAPAQLQVIDYSRNKKYRFLLATARGDIYLKDKAYKSLPGWSPCALGYDFVDTPFHIRLQGRDRFLALQTDGTLQMLTRRGKSYPGFPIAMQATVHNPLLVRKTPTGTGLRLITDAGKQVDLSLTGKIQKTIQLDRAANTRCFIVCPNQVPGDQYALVRQDAHKVVVMDGAGKPLFEVPYTKEKLLVQYYSFEERKQFYALTSPKEQLTRLYDLTGKQLATIPAQNGGGVCLVFSKAKQQLEVYGCDRAQCVKYVLKL